MTSVHHHGDQREDLPSKGQRLQRRHVIMINSSNPTRLAPNAMRLLLVPKTISQSRGQYYLLQNDLITNRFLQLAHTLEFESLEKGLGRLHF